MCTLPCFRLLHSQRTHDVTLRCIGTLIFVCYLLWLSYFNASRAKYTQESTISAADYTVEVSGLSRLSRDLSSELKVRASAPMMVQYGWHRSRQWTTPRAFLVRKVTFSS